MSSEFYKSLPQKRMASGVLLFNKQKQILILKPTYKDMWEVPGGIIESNESPRQAAIREIKEELGLDISFMQFLCVDYQTERGEKNECLQFMFYGGILSDDQINTIVTQSSEVQDLKFVDKNEALTMLGGSKPKRLPFCFEALEKNKPVYLENEVIV